MNFWLKDNFCLFYTNILFSYMYFSSLFWFQLMEFFFFFFLAAGNCPVCRLVIRHSNVIMIIILIFVMIVISVRKIPIYLVSNIQVCIYENFISVKSTLAKGTGGY